MLSLSTNIQFGVIRYFMPLDSSSADGDNTDKRCCYICFVDILSITVFQFSHRIMLYHCHDLWDCFLMFVCLFAFSGLKILNH